MAADTQAHRCAGLGCGSEENQVSRFTACLLDGRRRTLFCSVAFLWPGTAGSPRLPELPPALDVKQCPGQLGRRWGMVEVVLAVAITP